MTGCCLPGPAQTNLLTCFQIFDCDGVLWRGSEIIHNAPEVRAPAFAWLGGTARGLHQGDTTVCSCIRLLSISLQSNRRASVCHLPPPPPRHRQALKEFRRQGKRLLFVTNNSSKSRAGYVAKFSSLGLEVAAEEVGLQGLVGKCVGVKGVGTCGRKQGVGFR